MRALAFKKSNRLLTPAAYAQVFEGVDCKQGGKYFTFLSSSNQHANSRLGLIVAKRYCKLAVHRNRIKRRVRETYRLASPQIQLLTQQFDIVVIAKAGAGQLPNRELTTELDQQWKKLLHKRRAIA